MLKIGVLTLLKNAVPLSTIRVTMPAILYTFTNVAFGTYNISPSSFEKFSTVENLIKYDFVDKTQGTRYTALQFEKIGNVGHVFLDIPSGVSNTLNDGALLFNFPEKYRPKTFNLKIIISYSNGMTARTRYDVNTGNLYILSKILVPESMYLDTFYFLD